MKKRLIILVGGGYVAIRSARKRGVPGQLGAAMTGDQQAIHELTPHYARELSEAELMLRRADNPKAHRQAARQIEPILPMGRHWPRRAVLSRNLHDAGVFVGLLLEELFDLPSPSENDLSEQIKNSRASYPVLKRRSGQMPPDLDYPIHGERFGLSPASASHSSSPGDYPY